MLANMSATTAATSGIGNIATLPSIEHGQCIPFNFLKRKLNIEDAQQSAQQSVDISNSSSAYEGATIIVNDGNLWKRRHTDGADVTTATTARAVSTKVASCFNANSLDEEFININSHKSNNNNINNNNNNNNSSSINNDNNNQSSNSINNNSNNLIISNNNNPSTNDLQFSLANSAFINDLFSYDNNLIAPISIATTIEQNVNLVSATIPASTATVNVAAQFVASDDTNWQATDLLELDHRYNSTLQAVDDTSTAVTSISSGISTNSTATTVMHQLNPTLPSEHQQHQSQPIQQQFLIPQKQIVRSQQMLNRYRQHYQQQQHSEQQMQQQQARQQEHLKQSSLQQQHLSPQQQHLHTSQQHQHQSQQLHSPQQQPAHHSHSSHQTHPTQLQQSLHYINSPPPQQQHPQQQQQQQPQQLQSQQHQLQSQQQHHQSSDSESDFEDKNLSWLLNFKFDEFPHLSPDISNSLNRPNTNGSNDCTVNDKPTQSRALKGIANSPANSASSSAASERSRSKSPKTSSSKASKKFEELVMEVTAECDGTDMVVGENVVVEDYSPKTQKKPPFTYTELIEYALEDKGELTVSGIYQWISDRFPFYKSNDDRWKNSVRHNLSINPHFRKGAKAPQGAGHLWTISSGDSAENVLAWEHKKQRLDLFFKMESMNRERIQEHQQKMQKQQQQQQQQLQQQHHLLGHHARTEQQQCSTFSSLHQQCQSGQCLYDEAAAAAAAITQEMLQQSSTTSSTSPNTSSLSMGSSLESGNMRELRHGFNELHTFNDLMSEEELRKTAGQILNGIHREVEVQSVNSIISTYHDVLLDTDYLNPIHKDVAVNESGLRNTCHNHTTPQYYITEIDPIELGIQMSHQVEEEVLFSDEFNLNYFGYNASNDIVA